MFYEEMMIDGEWHYRTTPDGAWRKGRKSAKNPAPISVERFDHNWKSDSDGWPISYMEPFRYGEYVRHSDYAALLQQLAELEAEVERLRTQHSRMVAEAAESYSKATAAERAREEATGLLRRVNASLYLLDKPHREFGGVTDKTATDIAAFLAASGGKVDG